MFVAPTFADRLPWTSVDDAVRAGVEQFLGSPVVAASVRTGGFSPGFAGIVRDATGRSVFVKAISTAQNRTTPAMLRTERDVSRALPADPQIPRLLWSTEVTVGDDAWVALVFDAVAGHSPTLPWTRPDTLLVLDALKRLSAALTPAPPGLPSLSEVAASMADDWVRADQDGSPVLTGWVRDHLPVLHERARRAGEPGGVLQGRTVVHLDLRADNLVVDRSGPRPHVWFVDWPWACVGPDWVDAALLALDFAAYGGHLPEEVLGQAGVKPPADALSCLLALVAGQWATSLSRPAAPGMGGLRAFQRRFFDATVAWLERLEATGLITPCH